eukprot:COSAG01_NODE_24879_length_763_cov_0.841867_1_plen_99_part_10
MGAVVTAGEGGDGLKTLLILLTSLVATVHCCSFSSFEPARIKGIEAACCESARASDCSKGFPTVCPLACARVLVPFAADCGKMLQSMPKSTNVVSFSVP